MPRTLLVEDDQMRRDMLSRRLVRNSYGVLIAIDGQHGIDMAMVERPDPVIEGREATRRLRAEETTSRIPVIALTVQAMAGDREKTMAVGCDDCVLREFTGRFSRSARSSARSASLSSRIVARSRIFLPCVPVHSRHSPTATAT